MWLTTAINHNYIFLVFLVFIFTLVVYKSLLWLLPGLTFEFPSVIGLFLNLKKIVEWLLSFLALDCSVKVIASSTFSLDLSFKILKHCYINMNNHTHEWFTTWCSGVYQVEDGYG